MAFRDINRKLSPTQVIDRICELAKELDQDILAQFLVDWPVDIFDGKETAVQRLASAGDIEALDLLLNKFDANLDYAALGAAKGNHIILLNKLIFRGGALKYAVWGAAAGGHIELTNKLIDNGASPNYAIWGAAYGNHVELFRILFSNYRDSKDYAALGAAHGKDLGLLNRLLELSASKNKAAFGAGLAGDREQINKLLAEDHKLSNDAIQGAARSGNIQLVFSLINGDPYKHLPAIVGAASGGHLRLLEKLFLPHDAKISRTYAIEGAALGRQMDLMHQLITQDKELLPIAIKSARDEKHIRNHQSTLRFLFTIKSKGLRKDFALGLKNNYSAFLKGRSIDIHRTLFKVDDILEANRLCRVTLEESEALAIMNPAIRTVLSLAQFNVTFPRDLYFLIIFYMSPFFCKFEDVNQFYKKASFMIKKFVLDEDIQKYRSRLEFFSLDRSHRLNQHCHEAKNEIEFEQYLQQELDTFNHLEDPYTTLLKKHLDQFKKVR